MSDLIKQLSKPLTKNDVELRTGSVSAKGITLLVYKTARTDVNRLNEVCGTKWNNKHFYDTQGLLCCSIGIYDDDLKQWVFREDVGTESFTEKEKGHYSDSFKRAGFRWGIGVELYNSPFIFLPWATEKEGNKYKAVNFFSGNLEITRYECGEDRIPKLEIQYKGKGVVYSDFKRIDTPIESPTKSPTKPTPASFKKYSIQEVTQLAGVKNIPIEKICDGYKIESLDIASQELLNKIYNALLKK